MATFFNSLRTGIANRIAPKQAITNVFNEAFFAFVGAGYTRYDSKAITYIDKVYNENPDVYAVVSSIARKFSSVPGILNVVEDKKAVKSLKPLYRKSLDAQGLSKKRLLETKAFKVGEELDEPIERPNWYQSESEYKELWETFMLLTGNAYQWMLRIKDGPNAGKPVARFILPSHLVQIVLKQDAAFTKTESPISHYILVLGNSYIRFEADDVIHSKFPNPNYDMQGSHLYGQSPLRAALRDIQMQDVTRDNSIKTMRSGGVYGFIHAKDGQTPLTQEQAEEIKSRLIEMQASEQSLGRISGASAPLGFTQISVDTDKLQPFEFLKSSQKAICNVLGWSDKLLNNDIGAKYDNLDSAWKMSISNRVSPDLKIYEDGLNERYYPLFPDLPEVHLTYDVSELPEMQSDMKTLVEWLSTALDNGAISPREFRIALRYSDIDNDEMNMHFLKQGLVPLEDAIMPDSTVVRDFNIE